MENKSISEAVATTSFGGGRGVLPMNKNLKQPQTGRSPGVFFAIQDRNIFHGGGSKEKNSGRQEYLRGSHNNKFLGPVEVFLSKGKF